MKFKFIFLLLVTILIIPRVMFAAWWNPFSWFEISPEEQPVVETSDVITTQDSEDVQGEELGAPGIKQATREDTSPKVETTESDDKTAPTAINQVADNVEIDNLKTEIQFLKISLASIQSQTTNTPFISNSEPNNNTAIYEQILDKLNMLEQKVENLEDQIKDNNYFKLLPRVEALEGSTPSKTEDKSGVIKAIIDRVNLLTNDAGVIVSTSVGVQYVTPLVCNSGSADSRGNYSNALECGSLTDLKY